MLGTLGQLLVPKKQDIGWLQFIGVHQDRQRGNDADGFRRYIRTKAEDASSTANRNDDTAGLRYHLPELAYAVVL